MKRDSEAFDQFPADYKDGKRRFAKSKVYASEPVKKRLLEIHHNKCCYCERTLPDKELHVEHYRPRHGVRQRLGQTADDLPGYYWLSYEWTNLLLACASCNYNKSTRFPIANPQQRALSHHDDFVGELALFVDPSALDPRDHIRFDDEVPIGQSPAGKMTILGIGLNTTFLANERRNQLRLIDSWRYVIELAADDPDNLELQAKAAQYHERIQSAKLPEARFSSMAIDYISSHGPWGSQLSEEACDEFCAVDSKGLRRSEAS